MLKTIRLLLFPVSIIYGLVVVIRNLFYNWGLLPGTTFNLPVISVGNLSVGGSGKSPMTAYIVGLFKDRYKVATLSRGYGRKTKGFIKITPHTSAVDGGDEPVQFKQEFPDITVAVCEDRVAGINVLKNQNDIVILDDAYQHRAVKPGLSILLFDYSSIFSADWILPTGDLREPIWGKNRAQILVITKTPLNLDEDKKQRIIDKIKPLKRQQIFFSYLEYGQLRSLNNSGSRSLSSLKGSSILLLTGIANSKPLLDELNYFTTEITHHMYKDHHMYSKKNIVKLASSYSTLTAADKLIITTAKDAQRLKSPEIRELLKDLPVYYLPIKAKLHPSDEKLFNIIIENYVTGYTTHNRVH